MKTTVKRRRGDQTPRWKVSDSSQRVLGYAETQESASALAAAFTERNALQWALAAGAGLVTWDAAAVNSGWYKTDAYREHIRTLLPSTVKTLAST